MLSDIERGVPRAACEQGGVDRERERVGREIVERGVGASFARASREGGHAGVLWSPMESNGGYAGVSWSPIESHGGHAGAPWNAMECMESNLVPWSPIEYHRSRKSHGLPSSPTVPWSTVSPNGGPWSRAYTVHEWRRLRAAYAGAPWGAMEPHGVPCSPTECHRVPYVPM